MPKAKNILNSILSKLPTQKGGKSATNGWSLEEVLYAAIIKKISSGKNYLNFSKNPDLSNLFTQLTGRPYSSEAEYSHQIEKIPNKLAQVMQQIPDHFWQQADCLSWVYQAYYSDLQRQKEIGLFYTPTWIVRKILELTLEKQIQAESPHQYVKNSGCLEDLKVFDPCCGTGQFLLSIFDLLFRVYQQKTNKKCKDIVDTIFQKHLYGTDIDPLALKICAFQLQLLAAKLGKNPPNYQKLHLEQADMLQDKQILAENFDCIVGNPPYGKSKDLNDKRDRVELFLRQALNWLKYSGYLGFVVPLGITRTGGYKKLREDLKKNAVIEAILDLGVQFWKVTFDECIIILRKENQPEKFRSAQVSLFSGRILEGHKTTRSRHSADLSGEKSWLEIGKVPYSFYLERSNFPIYAGGKNFSIIKKMEENGFLLQQVFNLKRGVFISSRNQNIIIPASVSHRSSPLRETSTKLEVERSELTVCLPFGENWENDDLIPLVRGKDIQAVKVEKFDALPRLPKDKIAPEELNKMLKQPRILIKNISKKIVAAIMPAGVLPLDTTNILIPKTEIKLDLDRVDSLLILALYLNSNLADFYLKNVLINHASLTIHLDLPTLGLLPIPKIFFEEDEYINENILKEMISSRISLKPTEEEERYFSSLFKLG